MNNSADKAFISIGRIGSTYGVRGWVKIDSYTESGAKILDYMPWYIKDHNNWRIIDIEDKKVQNNLVIVKLIGVHTPEEARLLTGKLIVISRSQLPALKQNEYYWSDLEGLTVVTEDGVVLGKIAYLIATGANDVLIVKGEKEHAIPYLPNKVIKKIDLAQHLMIVDWEIS